MPALQVQGLPGLLQWWIGNVDRLSHRDKRRLTAYLCRLRGTMAARPRRPRYRRVEYVVLSPDGNDYMIRLDCGHLDRISRHSAGPIDVVRELETWPCEDCATRPLMDRAKTHKPCGYCQGTGRVALSEVETKVLQVCRTLADNDTPITANAVRNLVPQSIRSSASRVTNALALLKKLGLLRATGREGRERCYTVNQEKAKSQHDAG